MLRERGASKSSAMIDWRTPAPWLATIQFNAARIAKSDSPGATPLHFFGRHRWKMAMVRRSQGLQRPPRSVREFRPAYACCAEPRARQVTHIYWPRWRYAAVV